MGRTRSSVEDLRLAIGCLPPRTRVAMLDGIRSHEITVGACCDRAGGVWLRRRGGARDEELVWSSSGAARRAA